MALSLGVLGAKFGVFLRVSGCEGLEFKSLGVTF